MREVIRKFRANLTEYRMLSEGDIVVAAISGGADSMVMLHLLNGLRKDLAIEVVVAHLNHNLRGRESLRDFDFVKAAAGRLGMRFAGRTLKKGALKAGRISLQEAAREKRQRFLLSIAKKYGAKRIALGHTANDQAETILMRLIKGSSLSGLKGISPKRDAFIRPLMGITRAEVEAFAKKNGIKYVVDSSNLTTKYLRNDVRLKLVPYLKRRYNPNIIETLSRTAAVLREEDDFIGSEAEKAYSRAILSREEGVVTLSREVLSRLHKAVLARVLLKATGSLAANPEAYGGHFKSFSDIVNGKDPSASLKLPGRLRVIREYGKVIITTGKEDAKKPFKAVMLKAPGVTRINGGYFIAEVIETVPETLEKGERVAYFDAAVLGLPLRVRPFMPGDRIAPFGMKGHKKVKDLFIDKKVPLRERGSIPLVTSDKDVLWIAGVRRSDLFKAEKGGGRALRVEWVSGKG
ncbi:MAG: tRNA lysidine(34) synthetase TilS [Deltaproteobacteria bacterium]|nr:tRNA lysidine(34) synthetase TilS [Deltaproteobacteria bacterium]